MFEQLRDNLFVFYSPNSGSNAFLVVGKKVLLVDSSNDSNSRGIVEGLSGIGLKPEQVDAVLFTHGHADHFTGAGAFPRAAMKMHRLDANYVNNRDAMFTASSILGGSHFPKISGFLEPGKKIDASPFSLEVLHTPGHTHGSVCLFDRTQKLLFSGDTVFQGSAGRFDLQSGNRERLVSSLEMLKGLDFELLLPGHGLAVRENQSKNLEAAIKTVSGEFV